ncbi:MAG: hypothetical protein AAGF78_05045 [Pseudomonadota bacterium]
MSGYRAALRAALIGVGGIGLGSAGAAQEAGAPATQDAPVFQILCAFEREAGGADGMAPLEEPRGGQIVGSDRRPAQMLLRSDVILEVPTVNGVRRFLVALPQGDILSQLITVQPDGTALRSLHVAPLGADAFALSEAGRCEVRE